MFLWLTNHVKNGCPFMKMQCSLRYAHVAKYKSQVSTYM